MLHWISMVVCSISFKCAHEIFRYKSWTSHILITHMVDDRIGGDDGIQPHATATITTTEKKADGSQATGTVSGGMKSR